MRHDPGGDPMPPQSRHLVIDARPRGPRGPLAAERVLGRSVLAHLLDLVWPYEGPADGQFLPIVVHARPEEHRSLRELLSDAPSVPVVFAPGPPSEGAAI